MKLKRIFAYIIDLFVVAVIASALFTMPIFKTESQNYTQYYEVYIEILSSSGSTDISESKQIELLYNMNKSSQSLYIINAGLLIIYFGITSYILKGKTIGKKLMNIQIVSEKGKALNPNLFMLRQILVTNLIPKVLSILSIIFLNGNTWYTANNIIGYLNYISYLLMLGFMIFREDERGLHDLIGQTKVISTSKK